MNVCTWQTSSNVTVTDVFSATYFLEKVGFFAPSWHFMVRSWVSSMSVALCSISAMTEYLGRLLSVRAHLLDARAVSYVSGWAGPWIIPCFISVSYPQKCSGVSQNRGTRATTPELSKNRFVL